MCLLFAVLEQVPDPRTGNARRHALLDVLTIALVASICGCESCVEFADFAVDREAFFREFLSLEGGLPSHDTFSRLFRLLDPAALSACFGAFLEAVGTDGAGVVAIDGKTLRRSFDRASRDNPLSVVTAFASASRLVVGQESFRAADGDSEILAARALLNCLDPDGRLVTADALHCQAETARLICARGGDYLLRLKANRPALHEMVASYFADPHTLETLATEQTTDADHGRIEVRRAYVSTNLGWMSGTKTAGTEPTTLPGLACLGMIQTTIERRAGQR